MHDSENLRPPIDVPTALRNVMAELHKDPSRYRWFGIWWWPVKALLKQSGYGPAQLYLRGGYVDPETAAIVPAGNLQAMLRAASTEYGQNARYPSSDGSVENADGERVMVQDLDANGF